MAFFALAAILLLLAPVAAPATGRAGDPAIVFASAASGRRAIWTVRPNGARLTRLTAPPKPSRRCDCRFGEFDSHASWSADGRTIAFTRGARLYVMKADGSGVRRVAAPPGAEDYSPTWSARGRLAFLRQRAAGTGRGFVHEIVSVDRTGQDRRVLVPPSRHAFRSLAWSPDGRQLAYVVPYTDPGSPFVVGLFVVRPDGGQPQFVLRAAGMGEVDWSPDGTAVVLAASVPGAEPYDPYRLFTIRLSDRQIVQLTRVPFSKTLDEEPRWSPDGQQVVFTRTEPRRSAVYTVRPDGQGERLIVADARGAAWSADGRRLAFVDGVSGRGRSLTLTVITMPDRRVLMRTPLRRPSDGDGLTTQAWRP